MPVEFIHKFEKGPLPMTVLALHGTGGDETDLLPIARAVAPGASILSPRGKANERGAYRFFARKAPGVFDQDEVLTRAEELAEWIGWAVKEYGLNASKIFALGYSNGANIATAVMLLHPGALAGGVLLRPMRVIRPDPLPDLGGAPVLIAAGREDGMMPAGEAEALGRLLAEAGAAVDFAMQDEIGHELTPQDFSLAKKWLGER
jgi:phospholipase/carboxylesterase